MDEIDITLHSLNEQIDTAHHNGKRVFHLFAALVEFERDLIRERTLAGPVAARSNGIIQYHLITKSCSSYFETPPYTKFLTPPRVPAQTQTVRLLLEEFPKNRNLILIAHPSLRDKLQLSINADIHSRITWSGEFKPLRFNSITAVSSLLRVLPPLFTASVLSFSRAFPLNFSLCIGTTSSHIPCT